MKNKLLWVAGGIVLVALIVLSSFTGLVMARHNMLPEKKAEQATAAKQELPKERVYPGAPEITAHSAIMVNVDTGEILYEKNADEWMYPASMTKILTALLALEEKRPDLQVRVSKNAAETEGTYMNEGDVLRLQDIVAELMIVSDNGASVAVAENLAGSVPEFARRMNEKARQFGAKHSNFVNPNGLPDDNHVTTARDMMKIALGCWKNEDFRRIAGTLKQKVYWIAPAAQMMEVENTNDLLEDYPGTLGIKTGWTNAARGCLAAACKKGDKTVLTIVMHSDSPDERFSDTAMLFDYAFNVNR